MSFLISHAASALADVGHLLESVENPRKQLERALELLARFVPYDRCALLDASSSARPHVHVVPAAPPDEHEAISGKLALLHHLVSDRPVTQSGPLTLPEARPGMAQLAFPVIALDEANGVLLVERNGTEYEAHHLQLLAVVAAQLGGYMANVRLRDEEKRATSAMQRAADLLEHIRDGFMELDRSLACSSVNGAAAEILALDRQKMVGANARALEDIVSKKSFMEACERTLREQRPIRLEAEHYPRQDRWLEFEAYPTELGVSVFLRDVSERHASEQFRDLLTGIIGHDLRTPIGAITMSAASLLRRGTLDPPSAQAVARIASSGARMTEMVTQLLDLTRIRFGKGLPIQRHSSDLEQVCHDVVGEISAAHPARDLVCEVAGDLNGSWDAARLSQVLSNLVVNALEHGDPQSPVRLSAGREGDAVTIEVQNEGPAIPADMLPTIFEPFHQAKSNVNRPASIGLGLFIARSIVRAHDGTIEVASSAEAGTTFTVRLPVVS